MADTTERREKNRVLAEWVEPLASLHFPHLLGGGSPKGAWIVSNVGFKDGWTPEDFYSDEAAYLLLHQKLRQEFGYIGITLKRQSVEIEACEHVSDQRMNLAVTYDNPDLKNAMAEFGYQCAMKDGKVGKNG